MDFIYAAELKRQFSVFGHFYDLDLDGAVFRCRSCLEIVAPDVNDWQKSLPCAVVVMMNPGSSHPLDANYRPRQVTPRQLKGWLGEKDFVATRPDIAQYQIMRLMLLRGWRHVRVLNLSDLQNPDSREFVADFKRAQKLDGSNPHSLTHHDRREELHSYCAGVHRVIAAWGALEVLRDTAIRFLQCVHPVLGVPLGRPWYRYPSPRQQAQKLQWLEQINQTLNALRL